MESTFNPADIERTWAERWEAAGCFKPSGTGTPYCIMIPPPNVTGSLHMGHGFNNAIMDALVRFHRMRGHNTLWQPGTDHAGIATQMVVERQLAAQGISRHDLGREAFLDKVWTWKNESGGTITRQIRRLGSSVDWSRERFTLDEGLSKAVQEAFVRLHEDGLIYRGKRLVNWDPKLHTAISDLEVLSEEKTGSLWYFRYPLAEGNESLVVATTRPETMLGDTAVAVHPDDERYRHLIGSHIRLPITGRLIPIIADTYVDRAFGTGCVKITPAHDFNDYDVGKRHQLPLINILDRNAALLPVFEVMAAGTFASLPAETCPEAYAGLDRYAARKAVLQQAEAEGWLVETKPHPLKVPTGDRSGVVIEPWLTDQWYVNAAELAKPALEAVESGQIRFVPEQYTNMYYAWMRDIQDWCISRQLWWGHRIPAWYDPAGQVYVGRSEAEVRSREGLSDDVTLRQDEDVLDTWFSSALWTFSTLGWPDRTPELETFHPTDVLVTGFDIIFFWVARMIMMSLHLMKNPDGSPQVPFKTVYVHGLVRDSEGQKMSKSKGNVLDPLDIIDGISLDDLLAKRTTGLMQPKMAERIEKATRKEFPDGIRAYGTDALRFTNCALASTGRDIKFDLNRVEGYRNFCNKLWNAARYVLSQTEGQDCGLDASLPRAESVADRWIVSRLQETEAAVIASMAEYRFDQVAHTLYDFVWNEYCDWYLELTKPVLAAETEASPEAQRATRRTLVRVLETILRLAHPLIPFITEEIWQRVKPLAGVDGPFLMLMRYPEPNTARLDPDACAEVAWLQQVIGGLRSIRSELGIAPGKLLPLRVTQGSEADLARLERQHALLRFVGRLSDIQRLTDTDDLPPMSTALVGEMTLGVPLAGLIDVHAELARLDKEINRLDQEVARLTDKLSNAAFVARAPAAVVEKEQQKIRDLQQAAETTRQQRQRIAGLAKDEGTG